MVRNFALLFIGFAAGFAAAKLSDTWQERRKRESTESLEDKVTNQLESLEKSLTPA